MKDEFNRKWKWKISISFFHGIYISLGKWLIQGTFPSYKVTKPILVGDYVLNIRPLDWKIEVTHSWYEGPNCYWHLGPVAISRNGLGHCEKCRDLL